MKISTFWLGQLDLSSLYPDGSRWAKGPICSDAAVLRRKRGSAHVTIISLGSAETRPPGRVAPQRRRAHAHRSASRRTPAHATKEGPRPDDRLARDRGSCSRTVLREGKHSVTGV
eukprot:3391740-Prymnesium_polylepis.1